MLSVVGSSTGTITYAWQSSADGSTGWATVADATPSGVTYTGNTTASLSVNTINTQYYYRAVLSDGLCSSVNSNSVLVVAGTPSITATVADSTCQAIATTSVLSATPSTGASVRWYASNVSTTVLYNGTSYTTPAISTTTSYYAEPYTQAISNVSGGKALTNGADGVNTAGGIYFTANSTMAINTVDVYPTAAGTSTYNLYAGSATSGTALQTYTATFTAGQVNTWVTVPINWTNITAGTYTIYQSTGVNSWRDVSGGTSTPATSYPYNIGSICSLTGATLSGYYYFFYNWSVTGTTDCAGTRVAVVAKRTNAPSISITGAGTICSGGTANLGVTSSNDPNYTYTWTATNGTTPLSGATQSGLTPTTTTVYAVSAVDATTGNAFSGCTINSSATIIVGQAPAAVTPAASPSLLCGGGNVGLSLTGGVTTGVNVLPESFESGASPIFASSTGVTAASNSTYYGQGAKSVLLTYANSSTTGAYSLSQNIDLTKFSAATVSFKQICATETGSDYGYVQYSTNGGSTWTSFPSTAYSGSGTLKNGVVSFDASSYSDWNSQFTTTSSTPTNGLWKTETVTIPAAALTSTQFRIRFNVTSNATSVYYGWLVDDIQVAGTATRTYAWTSNPSGFTSALASPNTSPTVSTDYSVTVTNSFGCATASTTPASVTYLASSMQGTAVASITTICNDGTTSNITLTQTGGSLGTGAKWYWYTNASFGSSYLIDSSAAANASITVAAPTATTTYYVRAEGASLCSNTGGSGVAVTVNQPSVAPTSASASATTICSATNITLTQNGGTLGTGASWKWYSDVSFSTLVGTSSAANGSVTVTAVNATTTFYVRAEGATSPCTSNTTAANVTVTKNTSITAAISGTTTMCAGGSTNLSVVLTGSAPWTIIYKNGTTNMNDTIILSSPASISVSPTANTTYTLVSVSGAGSCSATVSGSAVVSVVAAAPGGYTYNWKGGTSTV